MDPKPKNHMEFCPIWSSTNLICIGTLSSELQMHNIIHIHNNVQWD